MGEGNKQTKFDFANFETSKTSHKPKFKLRKLLYIPFGIGMLLFLKLSIIIPFFISFYFLGEEILGVLGGWVLLLGGGSLIHYLIPSPTPVFDRIIDWLDS